MSQARGLRRPPGMNGTQNPHHERRWLILGVIAIAQLMVVLDATIVNIALPSAQRDLGFSDDSRQWIVTAYALAFGSLLLLFGRKWAFTGGLLGFATASAVGGAAGSFGVLVAARATQASSARCSRPPRSRCSRPRSPTRTSAARHSASTARSPAAARRS